MRRAIILGAVVLAAATVPAIAQPVSLPVGFEPNPLMVNVVSGGTVDVATQLPGCVGRISDAPSLEVIYEGRGRDPLRFFAWSAADTTLLVYGPNGAFYCDDDGMGAVVGTLDPLLTIDDAPAGTYVIWVGTLEENAPAILGITTEGPDEIAAALGIPAAMVLTNRLSPTAPVPLR